MAFLREIVITDPEGQSVEPVAFETFDACPFPEEIKEEVTRAWIWLRDQGRCTMI